MKDIIKTIAASGLLATSYASQEDQVVFDAYSHHSIKAKQVAIIGMDAFILSDKGTI
jgi:hypothetical protein